MIDLDQKISDPKIKKVYELLNLRKFNEAKRLIIEGIKSSKDRPELLIAYYISAGMMFRLEGIPKYALKSYEEAEKIVPDDLHLKFIIAKLMAESTPQYEEVIERIENIIPIIQGKFEYEHAAASILGLAYLKKGKVDLAIKMLERSSGEEFKGLRHVSQIELTLVENLIKQNLAHKECREFLNQAAKFSRRCQEPEFEKFFKILSGKISI